MESNKIFTSTLFIGSTDKSKNKKVFIQLGNYFFDFLDSNLTYKINEENPISKEKLVDLQPLIFYINECDISKAILLADIYKIVNEVNEEKIKPVPKYYSYNLFRGKRVSFGDSIEEDESLFYKIGNNFYCLKTKKIYEQNKTLTYSDNGNILYGLNPVILTKEDMLDIKPIVLEDEALGFISLKNNPTLQYRKHLK